MVSFTQKVTGVDIVAQRIKPPGMPSPRESGWFNGAITMLQRVKPPLAVQPTWILVHPGPATSEPAPYQHTWENSRRWPKSLAPCSPREMLRRSSALVLKDVTNMEMNVVMVLHHECTLMPLTRTLKIGYACKFCYVFYNNF